MPNNTINPVVIKSNLSIPNPPQLGGENQLLYRWLLNLVKSLNEWINTTAKTVNQRPLVGLAADRPPISPGFQGRTYFATDTLVLSLDDGNGNWRTVQFS